MHLGNVLDMHLGNVLDGVLETILDNRDGGHSRGNSVDSVDSRGMDSVVVDRGGNLHLRHLNSLDLHFGQLNSLDLHLGKLHSLDNRSGSSKMDTEGSSSIADGMSKRHSSLHQRVNKAILVNILAESLQRDRPQSTLG